MNISREIKKFNALYTKEERVVIVLGCVVTIATILFGLAMLIYATSKIFQWYANTTFPILGQALDKLIGMMFEGWTFF